MYRWIGLSLMAALTLGCAATAPQQRDLSYEPVACDEGWFRSVERRLGTGMVRAMGRTWGLPNGNRLWSSNWV